MEIGEYYKLGSHLHFSYQFVKTFSIAPTSTLVQIGTFLLVLQNSDIKKKRLFFFGLKLDSVLSS